MCTLKVFSFRWSCTSTPTLFFFYVVTNGIRTNKKSWDDEMVCFPQFVILTVSAGVWVTFDIKVLHCSLTATTTFIGTSILNPSNKVMLSCSSIISNWKTEIKYLVWAHLYNEGKYIILKINCHGDWQFKTK